MLSSTSYDTDVQEQLREYHNNSNAKKHEAGLRHCYTGQLNSGKPKPSLSINFEVEIAGALTGHGHGTSSESL